MTPQYLLEQALSRFPILLIKDEARQEKYLRDALQFYSLHAGIVMRKAVTAPQLLVLPAPLSWNGVYNAQGAWCQSRYDAVSAYLYIHDEPRNGPWNVSYFLDVSKWDLHTELPAELEFSLIIDLLEALIGEANAQALSLSKFVASLDGMESKMPQDYHQQKETVETQIRTQATIPDFAVL